MTRRTLAAGSTGIVWTLPFDFVAEVRFFFGRERASSKAWQGRALVGSPARLDVARSERAPRRRLCEGRRAP